jgi:hypothetical protein
VDRAVQRARAEPDLSSRSGGHVLEDGVSVEVAAGERDQDVEGHRGQRQQRVDLVLVLRHAGQYSHYGYIVNGYSRSGGKVYWPA